MLCFRMASDTIHYLEVFDMFYSGDLVINVLMSTEPMLHVVLTSAGFAIGYPLHLVEERFHAKQIKRFEEQAALYASQENQ